MKKKICFFFYKTICVLTTDSMVIVIVVVILDGPLVPGREASNVTSLEFFLVVPFLSVYRTDIYFSIFAIHFLFCESIMCVRFFDKHFKGQYYYSTFNDLFNDFTVSSMGLHTCMYTIFFCFKKKTS